MYKIEMHRTKGLWQQRPNLNLVSVFLYYLALLQDLLMHLKTCLKRKIKTVF